LGSKAELGMGREVPFERASSHFPAERADEKGMIGQVFLFTGIPLRG